MEAGFNKGRTEEEKKKRGEGEEREGASFPKLF